MRFFPVNLVFLVLFPSIPSCEGMYSKSVHGREAKSLKNGIPTLCKGLQINSSASPWRPPKQTNKQTIKMALESRVAFYRGGYSIVYAAT